MRIRNFAVWRVDENMKNKRKVSKMISKMKQVIEMYVDWVLDAFPLYVVLSVLMMMLINKM